VTAAANAVDVNGAQMVGLGLAAAVIPLL
jgi:hypothetical protein